MAAKKKVVPSARQQDQSTRAKTMYKIDRSTSAADRRMAEEKSKKKPVRADSKGRTGMGASKAKKPGMSTTEKLSWVVAPELMALGTALSKAETAARKKIYGSRYAGDPQPIKKLKSRKLK